MPRRMSALTRSGWACAYTRLSVDPHEPPNTTHLSILSSSRSRSTSATRSHLEGTNARDRSATRSEGGLAEAGTHVVFSLSSADGVDLPDPRWSTARGPSA